MTAAPTRKSLEALEDTRLNAEKQTVLAQPHRRGDRGHMTDNFGTFLRFVFGPHEQDQMDRCWEAGQAYIVTVSEWRRAAGVPARVFLRDEISSAGGESDPEIAAARKQEIDNCKHAMSRNNQEAGEAAENLILEDLPPPMEIFRPIKRAIINLAICLGVLQPERRS